MSTALSSDPVLNLVVKTLSRIEHRDVDYRELCMAAIVRNGYYLGLSYKSDQTFVVWRSGSETIEFYSRETGDLLDIARVRALRFPEIPTLKTTHRGTKPPF